MPNWASVIYICTGDYNEIQSLHQTVNNLFTVDKPLVDNGFGQGWLGCLVHALGDDPFIIQCCGEIVSYSLKNDTLVIAQYCADTEQTDVRVSILKAYPSIKIYYSVEEPSTCVFTTNDSAGLYFKDRFIILNNMEGNSYYENEKELAEAVFDITGQWYNPNFAELQQALDEYNAAETDMDNWQNLYRIQILD